MRTPRQISESDYYHVMGRGSGRQLIFEDDDDREKFLSLLSDQSSKADGELLAWCLMDNHFHLLLHLPIEKVACFMQVLQSDYALYFNRRHGREGHLFQDRYRSEAINSEEYLLTAVRYIHQNPEVACMATTDNYQWSSYAEYVGTPTMIDSTLILRLVGGPEGFVSFHKTLDAFGCPLDVREAPLRISDAESLTIALSLFGDAGLGLIKTLPKENRNASIRLLKEHGLTVRQIRRLTGISLGSISQA